MANAADIVVNLVAKTGRFERGMEKGRKKLAGFKKAIISAGRAVANLAKRFGPLLAAAAATGFAAMVKSAIEANDELGKMATTLGIATVELKGLQFAAGLAGVESKALNKTILKLGKDIIDATNGLTTYQRAFVRLNLSTEELLKLSPDEQLLRVGDAMAKLTSSTERTALAAELFGTKNAAMVNLLINGTDAIRENIQLAKDLGVALVGFDVAKFEVANDQLTLMKTSFEGIRNSMTIGVLPVLGIISEAIQGVARDATTARGESEGMSLGFQQTLGGAVALFQTVKAVAALLVLIAAKTVSIFATPISGIERGFRKLAAARGLVPRNIEIDVTLTEEVADFADDFADSMSDIVLGFEGIEGSSAAFIQKLQEAQEKSFALARAIQAQRKEQQQQSADLVKFLADQAAAEERKKAVATILLQGQTKSLGIAKQIAALNVSLATGEFIENEKERNAILERRQQLVLALIEAQQTEQGLETAKDRAKELATILDKGQKESVRIAKQIGVINRAIVAGEVDRNVALAARKVLIEELIKAQQDEQGEVSKLTEIGLQTLRNMQDSLASFFETTSGGFRGLVSGFTDMLRKMVAQLLARRILLSFLGLFAGGSGSLAQFAQKAIAGLQKGGPLPVGTRALVGEKEPEVFVPRNVLSFPTLSRLPRAVAEDVDKRHADGSLPVDQIRMIGRRGPELFEADEAGTVVPMAMFSRDVLKDIERRQLGGPLAAGQASIVGEDGPELFIPQSSGQVIPNGGLGGGIVVNISQRNTFSGSGPLEPATLIPLLEENNRKMKAEFVDELRRGTFS